MSNVFTHLIDAPCSVREAVTKNEDDTYTIFINARLSHERQLQAYQHAMHHIEGTDFEKSNVQEIEQSCHQCRS